MVLLVGFVATTAWTKFNKRRAQDNQEWKCDESESSLLIQLSKAMLPAHWSDPK